LEALGRLETEARLAGARRIVEKTPIHLFHIDRLLGARPKSKVVICMRDGRDVAASRAARTLNHDVRPGMRKWVQAAQAALRWEQHERIHIVRYEHLVSERRHETLSALADFVEEDICEEYLVMGTQEGEKRTAFNGIPAPDQRPGVVNTRDGHGALRSWQINQPLFDGRGRWKELSSREIETVMAMGGSLLAKFGCEDDL
jgi:hypothetical protein